MGATSYYQGQRFSRPRTRATYYEWLDQFIANPEQPQCAIDTPQDRLLETLMLGLRLTEGLSLARLQQEFGQEMVARILPCLKSLVGSGWVNLSSSADGAGHFKLSDPEGLLFSNTVILDLWEAIAHP
jgi:oxygen-independent coproporphyrinogen-3 oxidase